MYESGTALLCLSAAPSPSHLFVDTDKMDSPENPVAVFEHDNGAPLADPAAMGVQYQHSKLASVTELAFAFERAASRVAQMTGSRQRAVGASEQ